MSVCVENSYQHKYQNNQLSSQLSNISQSLPDCTNTQLLPGWNLSSILKIWHARARQRKQLAMLDDHLLKDIGYTREKAMEEYSKPFWK